MVTIPDSSIHKPPGALLNSKAVEVLKYKNDTEYWIYHGEYQEPQKTTECQHLFSCININLYGVKDFDQKAYQIGKCPICRRVHWLRVINA